MNWAKRIFLFLLVNVLVVTMVGLILNVLHVRPYLSERGLDLTDLMVFCAVWGMAGAFISLALSRVMAKWLMRVQVIDEKSADPEKKFLYDTVRSLTQKAGIPMPQVGIYNSKEVNAFATGPTRRRSLVAVSSGLLSRMKESEVRAVLAHEVTHIANGDMVTMTLLQGVVNAFVMFLSRILAYALSSMGKSREERGSFTSYIAFVYLFDIVFMLLGSLVIAAYSRYREFRADAGGARLAGKVEMIEALQALRVMQEIKDPQPEPQAIAAFKISRPREKRSWLKLFSTHPPLTERIERLQRA